MEKLVPEYPGENRATFMEGAAIYDIWLDAEDTPSPSITIVWEEVTEAPVPDDWCSVYFAPDGRKIWARIRAISQCVPIASWQAFLKQPESVLVRARL